MPSNICSEHAGIPGLRPQPVYGEYADRRARGAFSPTTHQNQFGGSIGGAVIKDKLFFFGDAQLTRNIKGGSVLTSCADGSGPNGQFGRLAGGDRLSDL